MTVGILGLGLIGGSLARAYSLDGHRVLCRDLDTQMLSFAMLAGAVESTLTSDNIGECDLILLAIYPDEAASWLEENGSKISPNTLVMDCCGVKREICARCFPIAKQYGFTFIGGHPMAGTHFSGFKYSRANLFDGAPMVLVPDRFDDPNLLARAQKALRPCHFGSFTVTTADEHDRMISFTSQMPHLISNAYIQSPTALTHNGFSAGSYKDLTRVAWLNVPMWAELFLANKDHILNELDILISNLEHYRNSIACDDRNTLMQLLDEGKRRKEAVDG